MEYIKKHYKYYLCFIIIFFGLLFFGYNNTDNIWNYGMAHAIRIGEIPYKDFNIIATPLYAFVMSLFLWISDTYLMFLIGQSILGVFCFYFVDKLIEKKSFYLLPLIFLGFFYLLFPNYNFLVFTWIIILIFLEKEEKSDFLIGFILGLLVLSKHTVGAVIVLCSLASTRSLKKSINRILGMIGPGVVFLFYLLITKSFSSFWNLSVMGIFDFGGHNKYRSIVFITLTILCFIYAIYRFFKYKKDPRNYYYLGSFFLLFPIIDLFHFQYVAFLTLFLILMDTKTVPKWGKSIGLVVLVGSILLNLCYHSQVYTHSTFSKVPHFLGYITSKEYEERFHEVIKDYKSRDNNYMYNYHDMFFDIASDHEISYFDIPLYGNFGYDGISSMKKKIDKMHDVYFYVADHDNIQYCKEINEYIQKVSNFSYKVWIYDVYYKE